MDAARKAGGQFGLGLSGVGGFRLQSEELDIGVPDPPIRPHIATAEGPHSFRVGRLLFMRYPVSMQPVINEFFRKTAANVSIVSYRPVTHSRLHDRLRPKAAGGE